jgi:hypothetical protein
MLWSARAFTAPVTNIIATALAISRLFAFIFSPP